MDYLKLLFVVRNLYNKCKYFIGLPIFAYICLILTIYFNAKSLLPSVQLIILSIPLIVLIALLILYRLIVIYRIVIIKHTSGLLIENIEYEWFIINTNGDLEEVANFTLYNPTKQNIQYLTTQYTSFVHRPKNSLSVSYINVSSGTPSKIRMISRTLEYLKSWDRENEHREVCEYRWQCEFHPPLPPGKKIQFYRHYIAQGTEREAFNSTNIFAYIQELPTQKVTFKFVVSITSKIHIEKLFLTDESGNSLTQYMHSLKKPKLISENILLWELYYPLPAIRYGFKYKIVPRF